MARSGSKGERIGIFGGTFDPIHYGHLRCAAEAQELLGLRTVFFVPAAIPPHKLRRKLLPPRHRLKMVRCAVRGNPLFRVSDVECRKTGPSYSVTTAEHFRTVFPGAAEIVFILGSDSFREITTWKDYQRLFSLCSMIVLSRPGSSIRGIEGAPPVEIEREFRYDKNNERYVHSSGHSVYLRRMTFLDISSTEIRRQVKEGKSITYLVPPPVEKYIRDLRLYQGT